MCILIPAADLFQCPTPAAFHLNVQNSTVIKLSKHIHICFSAVSDVADCGRRVHTIVWIQLQAQ